MFVILDTNHLRELRENSIAGQRLRDRLEDRKIEAFTCIVAAEEVLFGWLTFIRRHRAGHAQMPGYNRLQDALAALQKLVVLPFDREAADLFQRLTGLRPRIGTMDMKIASICLAHDALLLSRNLADFQKVPGLRVENWLD